MEFLIFLIFLLVGLRTLSTAVLKSSPKTRAMTRKEARHAAQQQTYAAAEELPYQSSRNKQSQPLTKGSLTKRLTIALNEAAETKKPESSRQRNQGKQTQRVYQTAVPAKTRRIMTQEDIESFELSEDYEAHDFEAELDAVEDYYNEIDQDMPDFITDDDLIQVEFIADRRKSSKQGNKYRNINAKKLRQGIIVAEILAKPKVMRKHSK
ncbi:hypothetical protein [Fundicoccus culcitae]|uniref:Uncharacterized protein n=1 Tax=Fundicoccus culcitae TaxID=2969821 RepID=A0ABY5P7X6_9LACT|nr:hypothetical protein [Fundicoccus culcitae]UUX34649.1 hypothetical protein NRE15_03070 [Fundicoccus culcitae]